MFNRLSNYWYNSSAPEETEQTPEQRAEQVRRKRLQQLQGAATTDNTDNVATGPSTGSVRATEPDTRPQTEPDRTETTAAATPSNVATTAASTAASNVEEFSEPDVNMVEAAAARETTHAPATGTSSNVTGTSTGTSTGTAVVRVAPEGDNPWAEWSTATHNSRSPAVDESILVSHTISRVFCVTITTSQQPASQPRSQTMLLDTAASHETLQLDILDQVLFERLSMTAHELSECQVECGGARHNTFEPLIVIYLLDCARKCENEMRNNPHQGSVVHKTALACREAALRMLGIVLLSNESWLPQDPSQQLVECLITTEHTYSEFSTTNNIKVLSDMLSQDHVAEEDLGTLIRPVLSCLVRKSTMCNLNSAPLTVAILNTLNVLVANKIIAKIVPTLEGWLPTNQDSGIAYHDTIIGRYLSCSTIRPNTIIPGLSRYTSPYFNRSAAVNQDITQHSQAQYQQVLDTIQSLLSKFLYHLIKSEAKDATLGWITSCLDANRNKAKLVASFVSAGSASDGFMLNLAGVLLKLSTPFLNPSNPKLASIDVRFCAPQSKSLLPQPSEDKILDKLEDRAVTEEELLELGTPDQFNFITTCFYLTHRALQLAYIAPFDKYRRLMKTLMETQRLVQDIGNNPMSGEIRERFETQYIEQLEVKTHLLHPDTVSHVLLFYSSSANWLSLISSAHGAVTVPDIRASPAAAAAHPSKSLAIVPSYFISSLCQFFINIRYFSEVNLENFVSDNLDHVITFLVLFCNKTWLPNPHTRAEIVEALTVFIPNERSKSSISTANRELALCSNALAKARLGTALISVFVDIEHTAQFEHKFQYRYHIFEILQYIWPRQDFHVSAVSRDVRGREEDTTVLFTKFIKLLLNDANFLLDEALHNLEEIKKLQMEQDNAEQWGALDEASRQGKLKTLAELKRMCTSHNLLSYETVSCIRYMTARSPGLSESEHKNVTYAFVSPLLVDTLVTMLNYYLRELVSESQTKYKVRNLEEVKFYPGKLLQAIVAIYINLRDEPSFISAIPRDGRSYHPELFSETASKLRKLYAPDDVIDELLEVSKLAELQVASQADEELLSDRAPSNYIDPILGTLMSDPVLLPTSKVVVDRSVIAKHLLSDPIDPFNRQPLEMVNVVPQTELREEIEAWRLEQLADIKSQGTSRED